jgi:hypothetical protein
MRLVIEVADWYREVAVSMAEYLDHGGDAYLTEAFGDWIPILDMRVVGEDGR